MSQKQDTKVDPALTQWQNQLMPFMKWMVGGFFVFFFLSSLWQLYSIKEEIVFNDYPILQEVAEDSVTNLPANYQWNTISRLEEYTLKRRYHQANITLMTNVWIKFLGFTTGMILSLCGAVFILGKIDSDKFSVSVEGGGLKQSLSASSPGIMMIASGVFLMAFISGQRTPVTVTDGPAFMDLATYKNYVPSADKAGVTNEKHETGRNEFINNTNDNNGTATELPE